MKNLPHQKGFLEAAHHEIEELTQKETFIHVERPQKTQILPLTWVFKYKFMVFSQNTNRAYVYVETCTVFM
jgi:hypothetical protein